MMQGCVRAGALLQVGAGLVDPAPERACAPSCCGGSSRSDHAPIIRHLSCRSEGEIDQDLTPPDEKVGPHASQVMARCRQACFVTVLLQPQQERL